MIRIARQTLGVALLVFLAACGRPPGDPFEDDNRGMHEFNRDVDFVALRPASTGYGTVVPGPFRQAIGNFAANLSMPLRITNNLLQGDFEDAGHNTSRFLLNTIAGAGGIFDVATQGGFEQRDTDFGETLAVWGAPEGAYLEVPFLGPRTERALFGNLVDLVINPVNYVFGFDVALVFYVVEAATILDDRYVMGDTLDEILYESADSYELLQSLYIQNRRFQLSGDATGGSELAFENLEELYDDILEE